MTSREAAAAAGDVKASVAIPIHWGDIVGTMNDAEDFKKHADCNVHILKKDESISLD